MGIKIVLDQIDGSPQFYTSCLEMRFNICDQILCTKLIGRRARFDMLGVNEIVIPCHINQKI